jgi:hypothetical protein
LECEYLCREKYIQIFYVRELCFEWNKSCKRASLRQLDDRPVSEKVMVEGIIIRKRKIMRINNLHLNVQVFRDATSCRLGNKGITTPKTYSNIPENWNI